MLIFSYDWGKPPIKQNDDDDNDLQTVLKFGVIKWLSSAFWKYFFFDKTPNIGAICIIVIIIILLNWR